MSGTSRDCVGLGATLGAAVKLLLQPSGNIKAHERRARIEAAALCHLNATIRAGQVAADVQVQYPSSFLQKWVPKHPLTRARAVPDNGAQAPWQLDLFPEER